MIVRVDDFLHCNVYCIGIFFIATFAAAAAALFFFIVVALCISFDFDFCDTKRERALSNRYCMYFCKPHVSHRINNINEIGHWIRTREFWWLKRAHNFGCCCCCYHYYYYYYIIRFPPSIFILLNFIGCHWSHPKSIMCKCGMTTETPNIINRKLLCQINSAITVLQFHSILLSASQHIAQTSISFSSRWIWVQQNLNTYTFYVLFLCHSFLSVCL